jgi:glycosyltransferase involved in cell wall biosynthesis
VAFVGSTLPWKGFGLFLDVARAYSGRFRFSAFTHDDARELDAPVQVYRDLSTNEIYGRTSVVLICSRSQEAFSLVALEASAFDVPIVFPRQPALLEFLVPGLSGETYSDPAVPAIGACLELVVDNLDAYHPREAVDWRRFDPGRFEKSMRRIVLGC